MDLLLQKTYTDPKEALDNIRAALDNAWPDGGSSSALPIPPRRTRHYIQLVIHEWIANLIRHATFSASPCINVWISLFETRAECTIFDNSSGFDLEQVLSRMQAAASPLPEAHMGLRIIDACAENVFYEPQASLQNRFTASIPYDHDPWMNVLF